MPKYYNTFQPKQVHTLNGFTVGEEVRIKGVGQRLTITHLEPKVYRDDVCQLIYQKENGNMRTLSGVPLQTLKAISNYLD